MNMLRRDASPQPDPRAGLSPPARTAAVPSRAVNARDSIDGGLSPPARVAAPPATPATGSHPSTASRAKTDELFHVIRQLCELLTRENLALKRHWSEEVKALTEKKEQLARLYQGHMNAVHRDPQILKSLEPGKRVALTQAAMRLGDLMQENASLLKANITSINMFFKAVTEALRHRQEERAAAYSKSGAFNAYAVTKRSLAVSFNQTM